MVIGGWQSNPLGADISPDIYVGYVNEVLLAGGFVFGFGMVVAKSCTSAHPYHLSKGSFISLFVLI
ncbi:MAG: YeeE/YedE family protein [Campylobacteraceae bacterium]|nr:YeeE/YedE family protein [Campylobacteraceae bacterium]